MSIIVPCSLKTTAVLLICLIPIVAFAETRNINPPNLSPANLGQKFLCHRPMRHGAPNMTVQMLDHKVLANNYGHGGSGWTIGPGVAGYVNNMLINSAYSKDLNKDTPITIIGAGVIGLYTAYDLYQKGYTNLTIIADRFEELTSHHAGGLLAPVSMDNAPQIKPIIDQISIDAYNFYASIANKQHPDFKQGATILPSYFASRQESELEPYVGRVMQPAKDVTLDFGNGISREMVVYDDGIFINTPVMMQALSSYLKSKNIVFEQKKINALNEIKTKYIINCTGLGSAELMHDQSLVPVQGHLIMLKDQNPADMQYMIILSLDKDKTKSGQKISRFFYMFPKQLPDSALNDIGVIGGTFIEGANDETPNIEEFNNVIQNAKKFYGLEL